MRLTQNQYVLVYLTFGYQFINVKLFEVCTGCMYLETEWKADGCGAEILGVCSSWHLLLHAA